MKLSSNKRVALFGGSFNPIHNGHIALAESVIAADLADEVWLMVSPQNPLKEQSELRPEQVRLHLAQLALQGIDCIKVSDFEFSLPRPSFTWNTLQALKTKYPHITFTLLIGGDNWSCFDHWAHYKDILSNYSLIVYPREKTEISPNKLPPNVKLLNAPLYPYSSTLIRSLVKSKKSIANMVPKSIVKAVYEAYS